MQRWFVICVALWLAALAGCVLGAPEEPGCVEDAECGEGFSCRAGACFKNTVSGAVPPGDAGADSGDAGLDGG